MAHSFYYTSPMTKSYFKEKAIALRRAGLSYTEILKQIRIAKSTLSEWLHSVSLSEYQKQRLTGKKLAAIQKGADAKRNQRLIITEKIMATAAKEIDTVSEREFWFMGIMLYWAEGSKEKAYISGSPKMRFSNTDPNMIRLFLLWLKNVCHKALDDLIIDVYIHELHRERTDEIVVFWTNVLHAPSGTIKHIYYKKGNPKNTEEKCWSIISRHVEHKRQVELFIESSDCGVDKRRGRLFSINGGWCNG
jgi:transcriptional regulator with XRE-family HTH domain